MTSVRKSDRGAVTLEAAIALGALTFVFGLILAGVVAMTGQLRCADAAREAARLVARGEPSLAQEAVLRIAPRGARLDIQPEGEGVVVDVSVEPVGGLLPGLHLRGHAYARLEQGESADVPG